MKILHFTKRLTKETKFKCEIIEVNQKGIAVFISKFAEVLRRCYIIDHKLEEIENGLGISREEILKNYLPDPGNVMAGDFGEIVSYFLLKDIYSPLELDGPKKWRFKIDSKKPMQYSDVVLFYMEEDGKASPRDTIVVAESKVKSTNNKKLNPIENAVDGAIEDSLRRLAVTLSWLRERAIKDSNKERIEYLDRFIKATEYGEFEKHFRAIIYLDSSFLDDEIKKTIRIDNKPPDFGIIIISVEDLKNVYEDVYKRASKC